MLTCYSHYHVISANVFLLLPIISNCVFQFHSYNQVFLTKLLTLGILFLTAVRAVVVAKLVILGSSPLTSFILALRETLVPKLVILALYPSFLMASFFTASLSLFESTGTGTIYQNLNLLTLLFKWLKLVGTFFNLSISNLSTSDVKLARSTSVANFDVSAPVAFFKSAFGA